MASTYLRLLLLTLVFGLTVGSPDEDPLTYWKHTAKEIRRELKEGIIEGNGLDRTDRQWEKELQDMHYTDQGSAVVEGCTEDENNTKAYCGGENVTEIPQNLTRTIEYISFFQTGIEIIPGDILGNYPNLRIIHFFGNNLKEISSSAFRGLPDLEILYLKNNELSDASFGNVTFEGLSSLMYLVLDGNKLTMLPKNLLAATTGLVQLGLESNSIDQMGLELISPLHNLTHLYLSFNRFLSLGHSLFWQMPNVEYLYLNYNSISIIETGALRGLDNLRHFEARHIKATMIVQDDAFNKNLRILNLSNNSNMNISTLALMNALALEEISLEQCGLTYLDGAAFMYKLYLKKLKVGRNPFTCDCDAAWMAEAIVESKPWALDWDVNGTTTSPQCKSPSWLQDEAISELYPQDLTCNKPYIEALTLTYMQHTGTKIVFKARVTNGQPLTKWVLPDKNIITGQHQFGSVNDTVVDSDHSVITQYEINEGFDMPGLVNLTLTATNVAGDSSLTFWVYTETRPSSAVGRPSDPTVGILLLLLLMLLVHHIVV